MPQGSEVCAARAGQVVAVKSDSDEGGSDRKFMEKANYVVVRHSDGTHGEYVHLQRDGARVKVGQQVKAGDIIALSGNTGFSSRPHLHFHISIPVDGTKFKSVPMKFLFGM